MNEGEADQDHSNQDEEFLDGANLSMTQKFLERRKKLREVGEEKKKKDIDRKASKNRQIRYVVHQKIVNFMPTEENNTQLEQAEQILTSLFG
mmetsp:Transcript_39979/g.38523  ORF Transcript_39979/g.38523 Transcript_39979/m.38523 type:complete len:92 (-) Transcript_39979:36-311(-)